MALTPRQHMASSKDMDIVRKTQASEMRRRSPVLASLRRLAREYGLPEDAAVDEMRIMDDAFTEAIWRERNRRSGRLGASRMEAVREWQSQGRK